MILSKEDIRNYTTGALRFQEDGSPIRMTETQTETFTEIAERFNIRCYNTAGIRIKLMTDGTKLKFTLAKPGKYAVIVNGLPVWSREYFSELVYPVSVKLTLEKNEKNAVEFVFPNYQNGHITEIEISDATYIEKYQYKRKFVFYGDSITQGMSADRPFMNYASRLSEYYDAQIQNQAISGSWFSPETLEKIDFDPDYVICAVGTNEFSYSPSIEDTKKRCDEYYKRLKELYPDKPIIAISPVWRLISVKFNIEFDELCSYVKKKVKEYGFILVDGFEIIPHSPYYFADGYLHPNNIGFSFYTENLIKQIDKYIK